MPTSFTPRRQVLLVLGLYLAACSSPEPETADLPSTAQPTQAQQVVALGRIEPEGEIVNLACERSGLITAVRVREGERVQAGQVLIELSQEVERARLAQIGTRLATQRTLLATDSAAIREGEVALANLQRTLERYRGLEAQGATNAQAVDNAQTAYDSQVEALARLRGTLATNQSRVAETVAEYQLAEAELRLRAVRAPGNGRVLNLTARPGAAITNEISFAEFAPDGPLTVLCEVDELFAHRVAMGQRGYIRLQGRTDTLATGTVIFAAPYLKKKSLFSDQVGDSQDRRVREVRLKLDTPEGLLFNARVETVITLTNPQ
ncbi:MAG: efflux RND transporter periplasmic adaptor subunit [Bacteroidia bacterium]|nr:efflux RND transporter periplasmic adaptor subunit [Bacteroidia bacterium]